jgi:hypothetical protein
VTAAPVRRYRVNVQPGWSYLIPGDVHFGCNDWQATRAMMVHVEQAWSGRPWGVVFQGDTIDAWGLSRFPKKARHLLDRGQLAKELAEARPVLEWAGEAPLGAVLIQGNHEDRVNEWLDQSPAVLDLPGASFASLTGLDTVPGLDVLDWNAQVWLGGKVCVRHGDAPGFPRKPHLVAAKYPDQFTIYGHFHQLRGHITTTYDEHGNPVHRGAQCCGHLSLPPDYYDDPDWQLGFVTVEFFGDRGTGEPLFRVRPHLIVRDKRGEYHVV